MKSVKAEIDGGQVQKVIHPRGTGLAGLDLLTERRHEYTMATRSSGDRSIRKSLRSLSAAPELLEWVDLVRALPGEPDRVAALVGATIVEQGLEDVIVRKFHPAKPLSEEEYNGLFNDPNGPLATFSARIRIGCALGLYGRNTRDDLDHLRLIRNAFAHTMRSIRFDTPGN